MVWRYKNWKILGFALALKFQTEMTKSGITAAGNWIIDLVKIIDNYPIQDALANIWEEQMANGGSAFNVLTDLAKLGAPFPLQGLGLIGNDEKGRFITQQCESLGINHKGILVSENLSTSYTDVMSVKSSGRRTFFHMRGANASLSPEHINIDNLNCKIFHLGYLLLLDKFDEVLEDGSTPASRLFQAVRARGIKTSTDLVSENSHRFVEVITPSLPHLDYLFLNEFEAERLTGIVIGRGGFFDLEKAEDAAIQLLERGVKEWVVLHFSTGAIAVSNELSVYQPALNIPPELIAGSAGAGDAFASGVLYGLHEGQSMEWCLKLAVCAAGASLFEPTCSAGIKPLNEVLELAEKFWFLKT